MSTGGDAKLRKCLLIAFGRRQNSKLGQAPYFGVPKLLRAGRASGLAASADRCRAASPAGRDVHLLSPKVAQIILGCPVVPRTGADRAVCLVLPVLGPR